MIFAGFLNPKLLRRKDRLAHHLEPGFIGDAVVLHLVDVPAAADAENKPPARQAIDTGHGFRQIERIMLRHQADAGANSERLGHGGGEGEADERIVGMIILLRHLAAARKRCFAACRNMGVLARQQRFETALFEFDGKLGERDRIMGGKEEYADIQFR